MSHEAIRQLSFTHAKYDECHYLKRKNNNNNSNKKQTFEGNKKQIKLPGLVGLDVGESSFLVLSAFLGWMSCSTLGLSGGDDVPYNIKDQLWSLP